MTKTVDTSRFREHRTRDELNTLLHYLHYIPLLRGLTKEYVDEHYPGWTWNELVKIVQAAGIYVSRAGAPPRCDDLVAVLHFSGPNDFLVEWRYPILTDDPLATSGTGADA